MFVHLRSHLGWGPDVFLFVLIGTFPTPHRQQTYTPIKIGSECRKFMTKYTLKREKSSTKKLWLSTIQWLPILNHQLLLGPFLLSPLVVLLNLMPDLLAQPSPSWLPDYRFHLPPPPQPPFADRLLSPPHLASQSPTNQQIHPFIQMWYCIQKLCFS